MPSHSGKLACWLASFLGVFVTGQIPVQPDLMPEFLAPLENHTVPQGRDVHFTCVVNHLGEYRVAWIKSDSKGILAIHTNMIALNPRLSVTYNGHNTWRLHVSNVQANDSGTYMCQINTDPMSSQMGALIVVIPPDIAAESASGAAREGGSVRLRCAATGEPPPAVAWRRDAARPIVFRHDGGREKQAVTTYSGEVLHLPHVLRSDMGSYYCIASNGVPPAVSRRYSVEVHFYPLIKVSNQLVAAPIGSDVVLECYVEASPKAMNSWYRENGDKLLDNSKYASSESSLSEYALYMNLTIRELERRDYGGYVCASANALGRAEGSVRLQELQLSGTATPRQQRKPSEQRSKARRKPEPRDASTRSWLDASDRTVPRSLDAAPRASPGTVFWWCGFAYIVSRVVSPATF